MKPFELFVVVTMVAAVAMSGATTSPLRFNKTCEDGGLDVHIGFNMVLEFGLYRRSCPEAESIVYAWVEDAVSRDLRMAASLLRLHFHDCFVNASFSLLLLLSPFNFHQKIGTNFRVSVVQGCDASVLLDDNEGFEGEKTAPPNLNSLRGFEVIDTIKSEIESVCPETVSCADILAMAARDSVILRGGPSWEVELGRKDAKTASKTAAASSLPSPNSTAPILISMFQKLGLSPSDMVALSGAHTLGKARCSSFAARLQPTAAASQGDNLEFLESLQQICSSVDPAAAITHLDLATPSTFDNRYFINLLSGEGLLPSDQALVAQDPQTRSIVETYAEDQSVFFQDFKNAMVKMGALSGTDNNDGEIRRDCRTVNSF
ncbi:PREDICTED: peroxidase 40 isoform X1 [Tarenaya hassleriana]|uniref:peroxidase 40 isoform X1 n=1 Tax=Tarenaya hassleriana TaxID=28532 RepID=UPI00053C592A|nr:PREDICTED: peroxidase 40 isoform X1 [Tarenaya hassleriana]